MTSSRLSSTLARWRGHPVGRLLILAALFVGISALSHWLRILVSLEVLDLWPQVWARWGASVALAVLTWGLYRGLLGGRPRWGLGPLSWLGGLAVAGATIALVVGACGVSVAEVWADPRTPRFAVLAFSPAILEEVLFRGVVFEDLERLLPVAANLVVAALLFAVLHEVNYVSLTGLAPSLEYGLVIGAAAVFASVLYLHFGLVSVIVEHGLWNTVFADGRVEFLPQTALILLVASALLWLVGGRLRRSILVKSPGFEQNSGALGA